MHPRQSHSLEAPAAVPEARTPWPRWKRHRARKLDQECALGAGALTQGRILAEQFQSSALIATTGEDATDQWTLRRGAQRHGPQSSAQRIGPVPPPADGAGRPSPIKPRQATCKRSTASTLRYSDDTLLAACRWTLALRPGSRRGRSKHTLRLRPARCAHPGGGGGGASACHRVGAGSWFRGG